MQVGAGTMNPGTFLGVLGPRALKTAKHANMPNPQNVPATCQRCARNMPETYLRVHSPRPLAHANHRNGP